MFTSLTPVQMKSKFTTVSIRTPDAVYQFYRRLRSKLAVELDDRVNSNVLFAAALLAWEDLTLEQKAALLDKAKKGASYG